MRSLESIIKANKRPAPSPRYTSADDLRVQHILERGQRLDFLRAVQQRDAERPVYVREE